MAETIKSAPERRLRALGISTPTLFWQTAFSRMSGLVSPRELDILRRTRVAIPGLGGVGGYHLLALTRLGVGAFKLADFDRFEIENFNRQTGATLSSIGAPKLDVMIESALDINPFLSIEAFPAGLTAQNLDEFLDSVDVVVDGLDFFAIDMRRLLFRRAWERNIPVITAGPIGFGTAYLVFLPGQGLSLDEYLDVQPGETQADHLFRFLLGLRPSMNSFRYTEPGCVDLANHIGPSSVSACHLCAGVAATEVLKIVLKRGRVWPAPYYHEFDPYLGTYLRKRLPVGNRDLLQRIKLAFLRKSVRPDDVGRLLRPPAEPICRGEIPPRVLEYIVRAGTLAMSGDNCQPWKLIWDGSTLALDCDWRRAESTYDAAKSQATALTFGALVENIRLAASLYGLKANFTFRSIVKGEPNIGRMAFEPGLPDADPLASSLSRRHTNRNKYARRNLEPETIADVNGLMSKAASAGMSWVTERKQKNRVAQIVGRADRILWETESLHRDLMAWIRTNEPDGKHVDGLPLSVLGLSFAERLVTPYLRSFSFVSFMNRFGLSRIFGRRGRKLTAGSAAVVAFFAESSSGEDFFRIGEQIERFWIAANAAGLSVQPMSSAVFFINMLGTKYEQLISERNRNVLRAVEHDFRALFPEHAGKVPAMLFRVGYSPSPKYRTGRVPLESVLEIRVPPEKSAPKLSAPFSAVAVQEQTL